MLGAESQTEECDFMPAILIIVTFRSHLVQIIVDGTAHHSKLLIANSVA